MIFFFKKNRLTKNQHFGFTLLELVISISITVLIFSFVLANFRASRYSGEIEVTLKQVINGIRTAQTFSLGGKAQNGSWPAGGYGIYLNLLEPEKYRLFQLNEVDTSYHDGGGQILNNGEKYFDSAVLVQLCGLANDQISSPPCRSESGWQNLNSYLEIIFLPNGQITVNPTNDNFKYVGGVIQHQKTGRQAYFYVSLVSGLVSGDLLRPGAAD